MADRLGIRSQARVVKVPLACRGGAWSTGDRWVTRTARRWDIDQGFPPVRSVSRRPTWNQVHPLQHLGGAHSCFVTCPPSPGPGRGGHLFGAAAHPRLRQAGAAAWLDPTGQHHDGRDSTVYSSDDELDGTTYAVRQPSRRGVPACSREYKGDAWELFMAGPGRREGHPRIGGRAPVHLRHADRAVVRAVHGVRQKGPCRARRDKPVCPHGRPLWCSKRHQRRRPAARRPAVRGLLRLHRPGASGSGTRPSCGAGSPSPCSASWPSDSACRYGVPAACRISYSKVVEFQARGVVHVHAPIRLDGPDGPDGPPPRLLTDHGRPRGRDQDRRQRVQVDSAPLRRWADLRAALGRAGRHPDHHRHRRPRRGLGGATTGLRGPSRTGRLLPREVPDQGHRGLRAARSGEVRRSCPARRCKPARGPDHRDRPRTAPDKVRTTRLLLSHLATLGYRGHPITKSRAYSVTFGQIRRARRSIRQSDDRTRTGRRHPPAPRRRSDVPDGFELVSSLVFVGQGYLDLDQAAAAVESAARSRTRSRAR